MNNQAQHTHFITQAALLSCGFEQATRTSTPRQIWNIHPHGGTAMRDALLYGNNLMMMLHQVLQRDSTADNWSFLHILITDGHDTDSNATFAQTYQTLSKLRGDLNVRDLKIIILGVDIEYSYAQQLNNLASAAGIHGQYHDITHTDIARIFHRIRTDAGMMQRPNPKLAAMNNMNMAKGPVIADQKAQVQFYAVLFTLDISGSMSGHKWDVTRHAVVDFTKYLGNNDVMSAIVFNDYPHLVMHWNTRQNQQKLGEMGVQPFSQVMRFQAYYDPNQFNSQPNYGGGYGGGNYGGNPGYNTMPLRQPLNGGRYVIQDPYADQPCCCC